MEGGAAALSAAMSVLASLFHLVVPVLAAVLLLPPVRLSREGAKSSSSRVWGA